MNYISVNKSIKISEESKTQSMFLNPWDGGMDRGENRVLVLVLQSKT